jgi:hypothetical protein
LDRGRRLLNKVMWAAGLNLVYTTVSFLWSGLGFAFPTVAMHLHEYALPELAPEVSGHIAFGIIAAVPTFDASLIFFCAGESILIDSDHILSALNYPVDGRLAHSVFFAIFAATLISYVARPGKRSKRAVFLVTLAAIPAHMSYDVFAGDGFFPILTPLSFVTYSFPYWTWPVLLIVAMTLTGLTRFRKVSGQAA